VGLRKRSAGGSMADVAESGRNEVLHGLQKDLRANAGKCVVIPGEQAPPEVHAAAFALNSSLGNVGENRHLYRDGEPAAE